MASFVMHGLSKGWNDFKTGHWSYGDVTDGFTSARSIPKNYIKLNLWKENVWRKGSNFFLLSSWKVVQVAYKAHQLAPVFPLFARHKLAIKVTAAAWIALNFLSFWYHKGCNMERFRTRYNYV